MNIFQTSDAQLTAFINDPESAWKLALLLVWVLAWKGVALWKASRNNSKPWFVALLIVNTMGILEIIYIFFFSKKKDKPVI